MSFAPVFKAIVFLLILFVMLYVGINNRDNISFSFPMIWDKSIRAQAALIYFAVFAVGVLAGTVLTAGSGKKRGSSGGGKEK